MTINYLKPHFIIFTFILLGANPCAMAQVIKGANGSLTLMKKFDTSGKKSKQLSVIATRDVSSDFPVKASPNNYFTLMFNQTLNQEQEKMLTNNGIVINGYIGDNTYILKTSKLNENLKKLSNSLSSSTLKILGISDVPAAFKIKPRLYDYLKKNEDIPTEVIPEGIIVNVYDTTDLIALKKTLIDWSVPFLEPSNKNKSIIINTNQATIIKRIAQIQYVLAIEEHITPKPESIATFNMSYMMKPNQMDVVNYAMKGPTGREVYFGNWETFGAREDIPVSLWGREVVGKVDRSENEHGCNTTITACGSNNIDEYEGQGAAPGTLVMGMSSPGGVAGVRPAITAGYSPLVCNHSVGWATGMVSYNSDASELDMATYTYPTFLQCYAAGNKGSTNGTYAGNIYPNYSSLDGDIKTNKNNFTVHSSANVAENLAFASFGPTADGRLKPDICAQGSSGTSFASPGIAGIVAVLFETYRNVYGKPERGDVVKAAILNTAIDMETKGIDFITGFGQVNPLRAINTLEKQNIAKDYTMPQGCDGVTEHPIYIPAGTADARIMLYWHDYPGTNGAMRALVNNLDLEVITPTGETILPWVLDATPANVKNLPLQKKDSLNNVEQITFENPVAGTYIIRVKGKSVVRGPQKFVLTWDFQPRHLRITSHPEGFKLSKTADLFVSWDITAAPSIEGKVTDIYFRPNKNAAWAKVASTTDTLYYKWPASALPAFLRDLPTTSTAQFKVVYDGMESTSGNCQYMTTPLSPKISALSAEKVKLNWAPLPGFKGKYIIYTLGKKYMEAVDSVDYTVTQAIISPPAGQSFSNSCYFALAARDSATNALSLRTTAITPNTFTSPIDGSTLNQNNYLCFGDTIKFGPTVTEGTITWYRNNTVIPYKDYIINLTINNLGSYFYELEYEGSIWRSKSININSNGLNLSDTLKVGDYLWNAYVFRGGNCAATPMYGNQPAYYGKFELDNLSFNSVSDLFSPAGKQDLIPGYMGCSLSNNNNTIVMKRKGFIKGNYKIVLTNISLKVKISIVKNGVVLLNYTSPVNTSDSITVTKNLALDEDCETRIEWVGNNLAIDFIHQNSSTSMIVPGNVKSGLSIWINPALVVTNNTNYLQYLPNGIHQNTMIRPDRTKSLILVNNAAINHNPALFFNGSGGLKGSLDKMDINNAITDFVAFRQNDTNKDVFVFTAGKSGTKVNDNLKSYVSVGQSSLTSTIGTRRKARITGSASINSGMWHLLKVQYNGPNVKISNRGWTLKDITNAVDSSFNIDYYTIGATFPTSIAGEMSGDIAEILHYNRTLTTDEEKRVSSYMALKHGFTLNHEYVNSSGTVVNPIETVYRYNIAGVACDSTQGLVQKQSESTEGPADILVGSLGNIATSNKDNSNKFDTDNTFMIWAHNNKYTTINATTLNSNRTWKLHAVQNRQPLQLNFMKSAFPSNSNTNLQPHLIVSDYENMNNATNYPMHLYKGGNNVEYLAAMMPVDRAVKYFTVGYRMPTGTQDVATDKLTACYDKQSGTLEIVTMEIAKRVEIISATGVILKSETVSSKNIQLKVGNLPAGTYVLRIIQKKGETLNQKLIIDK